MMVQPLPAASRGNVRSIKLRSFSAFMAFFPGQWRAQSAHASTQLPAISKVIAAALRAPNPGAAFTPLHCRNSKERSIACEGSGNR